MTEWKNGQIVKLSEEEIAKRKKRVESLPNSIRIEELKRYLADTDYITSKIIEGESSIEDYTELIAQRGAWRQEIRNLRN